MTFVQTLRHSVYNQTTMALSNRTILQEIEKGDIIIAPFDSRNLSTSSYDVTLGEFFFAEQKTPDYYYNPYDKSNQDRVWGTEPLRADQAHNFGEFVGIAPTDLVIMIQPGQTILAHTKEFIGGKNHITTMMKARSSTGRNFIQVCKCAGWGDVGYVNRWTMEISNSSQYYAIPLVVGRRIAQIIFFETGEINGADYTKTGNYASSTELAELQASWKPEDMLPKMWKDRDIKPLDK